MRDLMMTREGLLQELQDLNEQEIQTIYKMVQALKRSRVSPLAYIEELMNFRSDGYDEKEGVYVHRMLVTEELKNRYKMLHGGITTTFIDTAMGHTVFHAFGYERRAVTLGLNVHFLAPAQDGWLTAQTRVVKSGRTIIVLEAKVTDDNGKLIATATGDFFRLT
jgi:uncharacterized protein (TIGR00369 family)